MRRLGLALCALGVIACDRAASAREKPPAIAPEAPAVAPTPPRNAEVPPASVWKRSRPIMGTVFEITAVGTPNPADEKTMEKAFDEVARLEQLMSEWIPTSEVSKINDAAGIAPVHVSGDTLRVIQAGNDVSQRSNGAFDLSWAVLHGLYDFRPEHYRAATPTELKAKLPLINWKRIVVDPVASTVFLSTKGMAMGLGGIAKGDALDRAGQILVDGGITNFMIFGGGQVQVHGKRGDRPWRVGIKHPRIADYFAFLEAPDGTIATSGDYEHSFVDKTGHRYHHIIDVRTGLPSENTLSVTLVAPTGLCGDAFDTAAFIMGAKAGMEMLAKAPCHPEAVIVDKDFRVWVTPGLKDRVKFTMNLEPGDVLPH